VSGFGALDGSVTDRGARVGLPADDELHPVSLDTHLSEERPER
jgi:hypothetical protein